MKERNQMQQVHRQSVPMSKSVISRAIIASIMVAMIIVFGAAPNIVYAQIGSMATLQNI